MTQEQKLLSQYMKKLISLDNLKELHYLLDDFLDKKITYKSLTELVEFIQKKITNTENRGLLLHEIFNHPKIMEYPDWEYPFWFSTLFNIYANEPEKTFEILRTNFQVFLRKMHVSENVVHELNFKISNESKELYRKELMNGSKNISAEVLCIFLRFPKLLFPILDIADAKVPYDDVDYLIIMDIPPNYIIHYNYQSEFTCFNKVIKERLIAVLQKDESNEISDYVLLTIMKGCPDVCDKELKDLAKEKLRFLLKEDDVSQDVLHAIQQDPFLNYVKDLKKLARKNIDEFGNRKALIFTRAMLKDSKFISEMREFNPAAVVPTTWDFYGVKRDSLLAFAEDSLHESNKKIKAIF
jgi:hypothetical protein